VRKPYFVFSERVCFVHEEGGRDREDIKLISSYLQVYARAVSC
jgi:hypothetical protein